MSSEKNSKFEKIEGITAPTPKDDVLIKAEYQPMVSAVARDITPLQNYSAVTANNVGTASKISGTNSASNRSPSGSNAHQPSNGSSSKPKVDMELLELIIPRGERLPAAILYSPSHLTPQQAEVLDRISEEFLDSVLPARSESQETLGKTDSKKWSKSLNDANEKFRAIFGVDAFNAVTLQAAKEALAEKP